VVKLSNKQSEGSFKFPDNLCPTVFKCLECGSTIRRLEETNSYILMSLHREVETGKKKICPYCYKLREFKGTE